VFAIKYVILFAIKFVKERPDDIKKIEITDPFLNSIDQVCNIVCDQVCKRKTRWLNKIEIIDTPIKTVARSNMQYHDHCLFEDPAGSAWI
jgi:hypothetical protein